MLQLKDLRVYVSSLESTLAGISTSVDSKRVTERRYVSGGMRKGGHTGQNGRAGGGVVEKSQPMLAWITFFVTYYYSTEFDKIVDLFERFCKEKKTKE